MNVLVYAGNGTSAESVKHCIHTLRRFLSPYYAVISVDAKTLRMEPWNESKTSLLVIPGGADLPYCKEFNEDNGAIYRKVKSFVKNGGNYMGFCAGAYFAGTRCEFEVGTELEVSGPRKLEFYPGIVRGTAFKGFQYHSTSGERCVSCSIEGTLEENESPSANAHKQFSTYYNGGPTFVDADKYRNIEVLSRYLQDLDVESDSGKAAVVYCTVGKGKAILFGPHSEYEPELMRYSTPPKSPHIIEQLNTEKEARDKFLSRCLTKLGLKVANLKDAVIPKLTPLYVCSNDKGKINDILKKLPLIDGKIKGQNDVFEVKFESEENPNNTVENNSAAESDDTVKVVIMDQIPTSQMTPYFNVKTYFDNLKSSYGNPLTYGEVLTSTNSLIDKNSNLIPALPNGFTMTGTIQVSGRGRGGNVWVSPMGTLSISTVLRLSLENNKKAPLSFVQYLASMAMVNAIRSYDAGFEDIPVHLKWPNDIYLLKKEYLKDNALSLKRVDEIEPRYGKIGGLLINTSLHDGDFVMVVGCGVNVSNVSPTISLNQIVRELNEQLPMITVEKLAAKFISCLQEIYEYFCAHGFDHNLRAKYYDLWLHKNQIVTLQQKGLKAVIKGISYDYGFLEVEELDHEGNRTGILHNLQPDGNSFDMFKGLISKKVMK